MSRGRKPLQPAKIIDVQVNHEAVAADSAAIDGENARRLARIEEQYGDGDVYRLENCIAKAQFFMANSAEAMLNAGKQLIRIKEHEPHGAFLHALERIGIVQRTAQKMMQATVKFTRPSNAPLAAHLNRTKLIELVSEDDQELEELSKGGTLAGLTLDDIERMTKQELRNALRKERDKRKADQEAHERLLADKNKKIDDYARLKSDLSASVMKLRQDVIAATGEAILAINKLTRLRLDVHDVPGFAEHREEITGAVGVTFLQSLWQVQAWLTEEATWAEHDFAGSRIEIRATSERGPDLTPDEIQNLKDAGIAEAARVTNAVFGTEA